MNIHDVFKQIDYNQTDLHDVFGICQHDINIITGFIDDMYDDQKANLQMIHIDELIVRIMNRFQNETDLQFYAMYLLGMRIGFERGYEHILKDCIHKIFIADISNIQ